jgi:hypothetical protein
MANRCTQSKNNIMLRVAPAEPGAYVSERLWLQFHLANAGDTAAQMRPAMTKLRIEEAIPSRWSM